MKGWLAACMALILVGCATGTVDQSLATRPGVEVSNDGNGNVFIESISIKQPGKQVDKDGLPLCIAQNVNNSSVAMTGSSSTYVSPFTGIPYSRSQSFEISGGQAIKYVSGDGGEAVVTGVEENEFRAAGMAHRRYLRYQLSVRVEPESTEYHFGNLESALANTGVSQNTGFQKLGAWSSSDPTGAYATLEQVVNKIDSCLSSR